MEGCLYLIKQYVPGLSPSERKVAEYLINHPVEAVGFNITKLAQKANTSTAAIIRFANRIGYKGYSDLRLHLAKEVFSTEKPHEDRLLIELDESTTTDDIVKTMVGITHESIEGLAKVIDRTALDAAVETIATARHIVICGVGASGIVGTDLQQKLARLGLLAIYTPDSDMQIVQACALKENDALVAISYSGETNKVLRVVQEAKNNLTPTIAITRIGGNTLTKRSDINLFVPNIESLFRQGATISRINQLMVVDIVYAMILSRFKGNTNAILKRTWEAVSHVGETSANAD